MEALTATLTKMVLAALPGIGAFTVLCTVVWGPKLYARWASGKNQGVESVLEDGEEVLNPHLPLRRRDDALFQEFVKYGKAVVELLQQVKDTQSAVIKILDKQTDLMEKLQGEQAAIGFQVAAMYHKGH